MDKFEGRLGAEIRRQERIKEIWKVKLNSRVDEFKRSELSERYMVKLLFDWNNGKFEEEYLKKLEKN